MSDRDPLVEYLEEHYRGSGECWIDIEAEGIAEVIAEVIRREFTLTPNRPLAVGDIVTLRLGATLYQIEGIIQGRPQPLFLSRLERHDTPGTLTLWADRNEVQRWVSA